MSHGHNDMMWRKSAVETVRELRRSALAEPRTEAVDIDSLSGRVLAEPIVATEDLPAYDHATMDGYAFDATEDYPFSIVADEVFPEDEPPSLGEGEAVEIATGAPLPPEANTVLKREDARVDEGQLDGPVINSGTYTYARGSNVSAGERLFERGDRLAAKDAILLGDLGYDEVTTMEPFSVGIIATGTEIHEGRQKDLDSNMLAALIRSWGHHPTYEGTCPDEYANVRDAIETLTHQYDVVVTTGGTSVGHKDYVIQALSALGEVHFHRVRIRPGKPIAVATLNDAIVFAIPGKPLGAYTISTFVMRPFFTGRTDLPKVEAQLAYGVETGPEGFEYVVPVTLENGTATPLGHVESPLKVYEKTFDPSVVSSSTRATRADGFTTTTKSLSAGDPVKVVPYYVIE